MAKNTPVLTDLDYDLAMLGDPLTDVALDSLSSISEARYAVDELTALLNMLQARLEAGHDPYPVVEEYAVDLDVLSDRIHLAVSGLLQ